MPNAPFLFFSLLLYGVMFFAICVIIWRFYQILSKINDNIAGIRQTLERK